MRKYIVIVIGILFLVYGGLRIGVSSLMIAQVQGYVSFEGMQSAIDDVHKFVDEKQGQALMPFSAVGYLGYIGLMGSMLVIGAIGIFRKRPFGKQFIGGFLALYALLFINFQVINPKIFHMLVCALLLGLVFWLEKDTQVRIEEA